MVFVRMTVETQQVSWGQAEQCWWQGGCGRGGSRPVGGLGHSWRSKGRFGGGSGNEKRRVSPQRLPGSQDCGLDQSPGALVCRWTLVPTLKLKKRLSEGRKPRDCGSLFCVAVASGELSNVLKWNHRTSPRPTFCCFPAQRFVRVSNKTVQEGERMWYHRHKRWQQGPPQRFSRPPLPSAEGTQAVLCSLPAPRPPLAPHGGLISPGAALRGGLISPCVVGSPSPVASSVC